MGLRRRRGIERTRRRAGAAARSAGARARPRATERSAGGQTRLRAEPVLAARRRRRIGAVVVGVSIDPYDHTERIARWARSCSTCSCCGAGVLLARRAVGMALRPVAEMTATRRRVERARPAPALRPRPAARRADRARGDARRAARADRRRACATSSASRPRWRTSCARRSAASAARPSWRSRAGLAGADARAALEQMLRRHRADGARDRHADRRRPQRRQRDRGSSDARAARPRDRAARAAGGGRARASALASRPGRAVARRAPARTSSPARCTPLLENAIRHAAGPWQ